MDHINTADTLAWMDHAACKGRDGAMYPAEGNAEAVLSARDICDRCPVRTDCLTHALATRERFGVWGGLTESERVAVLRNEARQDRRQRNAGHCP